MSAFSIFERHRYFQGVIDWAEEVGLSINDIPKKFRIKIKRELFYFLDTKSSTSRWLSFYHLNFEGRWCLQDGCSDTKKDTIPLLDNRMSGYNLATPQSIPKTLIRKQSKNDVTMEFECPIPEDNITTLYIPEEASDSVINQQVDTKIKEIYQSLCSQKNKSSQIGRLYCLFMGNQDYSNELLFVNDLSIQDVIENRLIDSNYLLLQCRMPESELKIYICIYIFNLPSRQKSLMELIDELSIKKSRCPNLEPNIAHSSTDFGRVIKEAYKYLNELYKHIDTFGDENFNCLPSLSVEVKESNLKLFSERKPLFYQQIEAIERAKQLSRFLSKNEICKNITGNDHYHYPQKNNNTTSLEQFKPTFYTQNHLDLESLLLEAFAGFKKSKDNWLIKNLEDPKVKQCKTEPQLCEKLSSYIERNVVTCSYENNVSTGRYDLRVSGLFDEGYKKATIECKRITNDGDSEIIDKYCGALKQIENYVEDNADFGYVVFFIFDRELDHIEKLLLDSDEQLVRVENPIRPNGFNLVHDQKYKVKLVALPLNSPTASYQKSQLTMSIKNKFRQNRKNEPVGS